MEENNTGFSSSVISQEESDKIFGKYKSFDDYYNDPTHPYALVKVFIDGNELKASFTVEFTQKTNDHDTFKIITPDDSFDSFEGYLLEKSRYLFGKDVLIEFARFGKVTQTFEGIITNMDNPKHEGGGYGDLHILGAGKSILLESGKDCQSFEDKSLSQIIKEVCEDCPPEARVDASENGLNLPNRGNIIPYTVQYKESNYDFIKRLAKRYGEFFYYNGAKTIFGNKTQSHITLQEGVDLIEETFCASLLAQDFKYLAYNPETGTVIEKDSKNVQVEFKANHFGAMAVIASRNIYRKAPVMQFGNAKNEQELEDAVRLEREKRENLFFVKGKSRAPELKIGGCAELSDINGKAMETYRIIEIRHYHDGYEYYNEFTGIPNLFHAAPFIDTEAVPLGEIQSARVTDNNDPKGMGRVRVQFPWQMAKHQQTPWLRIVTPYAGAGKGQHFVPEIGEEVLINYESGNAEKPFVMGAMYNGAETSGYHTAGNDIKATRTRSGIESLSNDAEGSYKRSTPDGNFLHFDGQGNATLNVPKNLNINVGENFNINVGQNVSFLVGLKAIYNIGVQMLMNTPILKYFVADNYHLQSPKTLINGDGEIKIEAKETNVAGTQKLFMHSDESAVMNSKGTADMHGKNGNSQTNTPQNYKMVPVYVDGRCLVNFRPKNDWNGKGYGFDWIRVGDTKIPGDVYYGKVIGNYRNGSGALEQVYDGGTFKQDKNEFVKLMSLFNPHVYTVKNKKGKKIRVNYCVPWLSLYPKVIVKNIKQANGKIVPTELVSTYKNTTATLRVIVDVKKKPEKLELEYDDKLFSITHKPFPLAVGKHEVEMTITCLKEFATDQPIKVIATYKDAQGKEELSLAGKLRVAKNKTRYKAKIVFVQVTTDIGNGRTNRAPIGREAELKKYLNQALINPHFEKSLSLDFSSDVDSATKKRHNRKTNFNNTLVITNSGVRKRIENGWADDIYLFLNSELYKKYDKVKNFRNHYKIYFINESAGGLYGIGRSVDKDLRTVLVYSKGFSDSTVAHETLHSLGLYHSFDNDGEFTLEQNITDNIMDYSDIAPVPIPVISTYHWQWKIARKRCEKE